MQAKSNQDKLKNKFLGIEMSLEDSEIKYHITKEDIQKIQTVKSKEIPLIFLYSDFILRTLKVVLHSIAKVLQFVGIEFLTPIIKELKKTITYTVQKASNLKDQNEVKMESYLTKVESKFALEKEAIQLNIQKLDNLSQNYIQELTRVLAGIPNKVEFICEKKELEKVNASLEFDISLYEAVILKLSNSKMISNILNFEIISKVDEKNITNTIVIDLKVSGEKWAALFSKHVAADVLSKIESYKGKVKNQHIVDPKFKKEKFIFSFTHQRLDHFMDVAREERNYKQKIHSAQNMQIDV